MILDHIIGRLEQQSIRIRRNFHDATLKFSELSLEMNKIERNQKQKIFHANTAFENAHNLLKSRYEKIIRLKRYSSAAKLAAKLQEADIRDIWNQFKKDFPPPTVNNDSE